MDITTGKEIVKPHHKISNHLGDSFMHMFDGIHFRFPSYKHDHPPVINVNEVADEQLTVGQKVADKVASSMGSWNFIIGQALLMVVWITLNLVGCITGTSIPLCSLISLCQLKQLLQLL